MKIMNDFILGIIMLITPLLIVFVMLIRWWKDYKKSKKPLVLYDKNTKYWLIVFVPLLVILIGTIWVSFFEVESSPIKIRFEDWNPWGWYT